MVAPLKQKGDLAELMVAADLRRRGYVISIPFGEDCNYDLVLDRGPLERVQVKYSTSNGEIVVVRCRSHSLTKGRVRETKADTERAAERDPLVRGLRRHLTWTRVEPAGLEPAASSVQGRRSPN